MRGSLWAGGLLSIFFCSSLFAENQKWTLFVLMEANNNLHLEAYKDIREMETMGSNSNVQVIVQLDSSDNPNIQRFRIEKNSSVEKEVADEKALKFNSPLVEYLPRENPTDAQTLKDFIRFGVENYPAEHYALIFWGHGSGWNNGNSNYKKRISSFNSLNPTISAENIAMAFVEIKEEKQFHPDIVIFDACSMGMIEVAKSFVGLADFLVASGDDIPGRGFPYHDILRTASEKENLDSLQFSKLIVTSFVASYLRGSQGHLPTSMAAIDLNKIDILESQLNSWTEKLENHSGISSEIILNEADRTLNFLSGSSRDLGNYVENIAKHESNAEFIEATENLRKAIKEAVVINSTTSARYKRATGLTIYLPINRYGESTWGSPYLIDRLNYEGTDWARTSRWTQHLDFLFPRRYPSLAMR